MDREFPKGPEIAEQDVAGLEVFLGKQLPEDYKAFLLEFNGGEPIECAIDFDGEKIKISGATVATFFEVSDDISYGIQPSAEKHSDLVPEDCIVIATTPAGNLFFLSLRDDSFGQVFYKDHEIEGISEFLPSQEQLPENIVFVSVDFGDFIERLYDPDEE